jgi:hypothetical protein
VTLARILKLPIENLDWAQISMMNLERLFGLPRMSTLDDNRSCGILQRLVKSQASIALAEAVLLWSFAEDIQDFFGYWRADILFWIADHGLNLKHGR